MSDVLQKISKDVLARLERRKAALPLKELQARTPSRKPGKFIAPRKSGPPTVIAEIKFRSPSAGELAGGSAAQAIEVARGYFAAGAAALSILTEQDHFSGSPEYLAAVRGAFPDSSLLMKDFLLEEYQLHEALHLGADCILLIVALLGKDRTSELLATARRLGLQALVEVHDEKEMEIAVSLGAPLIGVNNRDLKTLEISLDVSRRLAPMKPRGALLVCESGIRSGEQIREMSALGFDAFLVGTSLMGSGNAGSALATLIRSAGEAQ